MVDLLHEIEEKAFLGSEFLTWLLMHLMKDGEHFDIPKVGSFDLVFDRQIVLEGEDTGAKKITITGQTVSVWVSTNNLTPASGGNLENAGTTIASFSDDAIGTSRPQGAAWDIGAIERIAAAVTRRRIILSWLR